MKRQNRDQLPSSANVPQKSSLLRLAYDDFLLSREVMRCSDKTLIHYRYSTGQFVDWLEGHGVTAPTEIRPAHVRARLAEVAGMGVKDTTQHVHARGIKTFLRFLQSEQYIQAEIKIVMPRLDHKRMPSLSVDEVHRVLKHCENPRNTALILLMVDSGLRLAETCALTWGDIDAKSGLVRVVRGKGGKARSVVVGAKTRRALIAYRRWCIQLTGRDLTDADGVWLSLNTHEPIKANAITLALRRIGKAAGINLSPHMLRRTFATFSLRAGMNPLHLQGLLGHSTLEMTRRYVQILDEDLKEAHEKYGAIDTWL